MEVGEEKKGKEGEKKKNLLFNTFFNSHTHTTFFANHSFLKGSWWGGLGRKEKEKKRRERKERKGKKEKKRNRKKKDKKPLIELIETSHFLLD